VANTKLNTATAPGRLDAMGGIADYSGSWVLQMPIAECLFRFAMTALFGDASEDLNEAKRISMGWYEFKSPESAEN
jgi:hypothetical protein